MNAETFIMFIAAGIGGYIGAYLKEKGKNLATREDVEKITRIVESVKHDNAKELAELSEYLRLHGSMRQAALEKRLEVHQAAYRFAAVMIRDLGTEGEERRSVENELSSFWLDNCLYLDDPARGAFDDAWTAFLRDRIMSRPGTAFSAEDHERNFSKLLALSEAIEKTVSLPTIRIDHQLLKEAGAA